MDEERMKRFLKEVRKQRENEFCKRTGHYYEEEDGCRNCGKPFMKALERGNAQ